MEEAILYSWIGVVLYFVLIVIVTIKYYARIKGLSDFIVAGRSLGLVVTWGTILATWYCSGTALGGAMMSYLYGLRGVIMDPIGSGLSVVLFGLFFASTLRRMRYLTISDFFKTRYGPEMEIASAIVQILGYIGWLGGLLMAQSIVFQVLLGVNYEVGLYIATIFTAIYTALGGLLAVAIVDYLRVFIFWIAVWILLAFALAHAGGFEALASLGSDAFSILPGRNFEYLGYVGFFGMLYYIASWINQGLGSLSCQDLVQRGLSARDEKTSRDASILAGVSYWIIGITGGALIGLLGRILIPDLEDPSVVMVAVAQKVLPPALFAFFIVGLLATIMSSSDSAALIPPSMFVNNILPYMTKREITETYKLRLVRILTIVSTIGALLIAMYLPHLYFLTQMAWYLMLFVQAIPFILGVYWKKANRIGAIAQMVFNVVAWIVLGAYFYGETGDVWAAFYMPGPLILPVGLVIFIVASILTQKSHPPKPLTPL
jgi:SSS family solute:Na+ symporter